MTIQKHNKTKIRKMILRRLYKNTRVKIHAFEIFGYYQEHFSNALTYSASIHFEYAYIVCKTMSNIMRFPCTQPKAHQICDGNESKLFLDVSRNKGTDH